MIGGIVLAILAGLIMTPVIIFWNDTAASVLWAIFLLIVGYGLWGNGKLTFGLKGLLTLGGIVCIFGCASVFYFIGWVAGINPDEVAYIGLAAGTGGVLGVTSVLTKDK